MSLRKIADREHVSHTTARRKIQFAHAVKFIAETVGENPMDLADLDLGQREVQLLAGIADAEPELARLALDGIKQGKTQQGAGKKNEANQIVGRIYEQLTGEPLNGTKSSDAAVQVSHLSR